MIKIKDVAFFAYAVTDVPKARAFYEGVLGLVPTNDYPATPESMWVEYAIGSTTLGIGASPSWKPSEDGASLALEVEDFDATVAELKEKNVTFKLEPQEYPSCKMAVICDPDKNSLLIHQVKSK